MTDRFPHLFSPLNLRGLTLRNRILSTGHDTTGQRSLQEAASGRRYREIRIRKMKTGSHGSLRRTSESRLQKQRRTGRLPAISERTGSMRPQVP